MKKVLFILILFFILILPVKGEESLDTYWSTEVINDSNTELIKVERRYKWYDEEISYSSDYYANGNNPYEYPNKVTDDYIETPFSDWYDGNLPNDLSGKTIETRLVNKYRLLKPVKYILFNNIIGGFTNLFMTELNILINNNEIDYHLECIGCHDNFEQYLKDGNIQRPGTYIENNGSLKIDLRAYYDVNQIKIELYMYDDVPNTKKFDIYMNEGGTLDEHSSIHKRIDIYNISQSFETPDRYMIFPDYDWLDNPIYTDWIYTTDFYNTTYYRQMVITNEYRYKEIKYRYSGIKKEYTDDYYVNYEDPNYQKDINQYQDYYLYHIKDEQHDEIPDQEEENEPATDNPPSNEEDKPTTDNPPSNEQNDNNLNDDNNKFIADNDKKDDQKTIIIYKPSNTPKDVDEMEKEKPSLVEIPKKDITKQEGSFFINKKSIIIILTFLWVLILASIFLLIELWKRKKSVV